MNDKPIPRRLYKYRPFNADTLGLFTDSELYYADPTKFNDPLDCSPTILVDVDRSSIEKLCYRMLVDWDQDKAQATEVMNNLRYDSTEYGDYRTDESVDRYLAEQLVGREVMTQLNREMKGKGVLSLSETWKSPLMWSHYADGHRGLCIEYDTTLAEHPNLSRVDYRSTRNVRATDLIQWKIHGSSSAQRRVHDTYFFAKSSEWRYEREWRDIKETSGLGDPLFKITAIHFGIRCPYPVITALIHLLRSCDSIKYYGMTTHQDGFKLRRSLIDKFEVEQSGVRGSGGLLFNDVFIDGDSNLETP